MTNEALESLIRYAQEKLLADLTETDDKTAGIACRGLIPIYEQDRQYGVGDVRLHPTTGYPRECMTAYDGSVQQDWTIDNRTLRKPVAQPKKGICSAL